jgi:hypothetical protein
MNHVLKTNIFEDIWETYIHIISVLRKALFQENAHVQNSME